MARSLDEAMLAADNRFRALEGGPDADPETVAMRAMAVHFRPVYLGLPVEADEAIDYATAGADEAMMWVVAGGNPVEVLRGQLMRTLLVGLLVDGD